MPYAKTDKTYTHEHKSYVVYKGGSNGNTRFIRLNRKFTSVPSLQVQQKGAGYFDNDNINDSGAYVTLKQNPELVNELKELKKKTYITHKK